MSFLWLCDGLSEVKERANQTEDASPSDSQMLRYGLFPDPLVPVGAQTEPDENRGLAAALVEYRRASHPDDLDPILSFMHQYPNSPWNASLLPNLGILYRKTGHFSNAMTAWEAAWEQSKNLNDMTGKPIADAALGKLVEFYAYLGRTEELSALLKSVEGRSLTGAATEDRADAAEGLAMMRQRPDLSFRCGPLALERIALSQGNKAALPVLEQAASTMRGTSLVQLLELSKKAGLNYQMAYRTPGSEIIVPAVVHWKVGHFAAILGYLVLSPLWDVSLRQLCAFAEEELFHLLPHDFLRVRIDGVQTVLIHEHLGVLDPERPGFFRDIFEDPFAELSLPGNAIKAGHFFAELDAHHSASPERGGGGFRRFRYTAAFFCHSQPPRKYRAPNC